MRSVVENHDGCMHGSDGMSTGLDGNGLRWDRMGCNRAGFQGVLALISGAFDSVNLYDSAVFTALNAVWGYKTSRGFIEPYPFLSAERVLGSGWTQTVSA